MDISGHRWLVKHDAPYICWQIILAVQFIHLHHIYYFILFSILFLCLPAFHSKELKQDYNHHVNKNITKSKALHMEHTLWRILFLSLNYWCTSTWHFLIFFFWVREQSLKVELRKIRVYLPTLKSLDNREWWSLKKWCSCIVMFKLPNNWHVKPQIWCLTNQHPGVSSIKDLCALLSLNFR